MHIDQTTNTQAGFHAHFITLPHLNPNCPEGTDLQCLLRRFLCQVDALSHHLWQHVALELLGLRPSAWVSF